MPADFPYLPAVKNVPSLFAKIKSAGSPPKFTYEFLSDTLGFKSSNDRSFIGVLKRLGFLTPDGVPTKRYNDFRGVAGATAVAMGLREGWSEVFLANQEAQTLGQGELVGLFKSLTGKGDAVSEKMASTFRALASVASWDTEAAPSGEEPGDIGDAGDTILPPAKRSMTLHTDVHVHLPPTTDVSVYAAIFRAIREELI